MLGVGMLSVTSLISTGLEMHTYPPPIAADSHGIKAAGLANTLIQDMTWNFELEDLYGVPTWTDHQMFSLFVFNIALPQWMDEQPESLLRKEIFFILQFEDEQLCYYVYSLAFAKQESCSFIETWNSWKCAVVFCQYVVAFIWVLSYSIQSHQAWYFPYLP